MRGYREINAKGLCQGFVCLYFMGTEWGSCIEELPKIRGPSRGIYGMYVVRLSSEAP